jgi:hypothetical protein
LIVNPKAGGISMTAYTVTFSLTTHHQTTILANSKEDFLVKVAKLIFSQESPHPTEKFSLDDQDLEIETLHVEVNDVTSEEE